MDFLSGNGSNAKSFACNLTLNNNDPGKSQIKSFKIFLYVCTGIKCKIEFLVGYNCLQVTKKLTFPFKIT